MRILFILFFSITLISCSQEYFDHIRRESTPIVSSSGATLAISWALYSLPDTEVLDSIITDIDAAKRRIWIETYTWTEKETLNAVIRAKHRWIDVQVVLEPNVYNTPWINTETVKKLQNAGVEFSYAENQRYKFTHIKTWIIDDRWCISTGNWSYTSFTKNREFIYCSSDTSLLRDIEEIFHSDFHHIRPYFPWWIDPRIWLAPENIRPWLKHILWNAKKEIIVYNQSISDPEMIHFFEKKSWEWVKISLCQADHDDDFLSSSWKTSWDITFLTSKKPYLHAKAFLIDGKESILWSANLTQNALDNNREILIFFPQNQALYDTVFSFYKKDCHSSS
jgi:cardiolipin synthase